MSELRKAAEQAATDLEELIHWHGIRGSDDKLMPAHNQTPEIKSAMETLEALQKALAQPEQEPVGWLNANEVVDVYAFTWRKKETHDIPLYTAPPKQEWQELTPNEEEDVLKGSKNAYDAIKRISAKLKEKNT